MSDIIVTEADREAARTWNAEHGGCCEVALAQLLARHAAQARIEALEEAAKVADNEASNAWQIANALGQNSVCASGRNHSARSIANAIRNLSTRGDQK
jgi:dihydroxyacetone kinase